MLRIYILLRIKQKVLVIVDDSGLGTRGGGIKYPKNRALLLD